MIDTSEKEAVFEVQSVPEEGRTIKEVDNLNKLDPCIIDYESLTALVEELKSFYHKFSTSSKSLHVEKNLPETAKKKLKCFLRMRFYQLLLVRGCAIYFTN